MIDLISFAVGFIAGTVAMAIASYVTDQRARDQDHSRRTRYVCEACDEPISGERAAKLHAEYEHNAPPDDQSWRFIISEVTTDGAQ